MQKYIENTLQGLISVCSLKVLCYTVCFVRSQWYILLRLELLLSASLRESEEANAAFQYIQPNIEMETHVTLLRYICCRKKSKHRKCIGLQAKKHYNHHHLTYHFQMYYASKNVFNEIKNGLNWTIRANNDKIKNCRFAIMPCSRPLKMGLQGAFQCNILCISISVGNFDNLITQL